MRPHPLRAIIASRLEELKTAPECQAMIAMAALPAAAAGACAATSLKAFQTGLEALGQAGARVFLDEAEARAEIAVQLLVSLPKVSAAEVLPAVVWLDSGKLLLAATAEVPGPMLPDPPGPSAAAVLEEEAARHGIDHALAGKWGAELLGLPVPSAEAIWLHHHSLATVALAADKPLVCYFAALTDALAVWEAGTGPTPWITALCKRLGIDPEAALAASTSRGAASATAAPAGPPASPVEAQFRAVCAMHEAFHAAETPEAVALALGEALYGAFGCPRGLCRAGESLVRWDHGAPQAVEGTAWHDHHAVSLPLAHAGQLAGEAAFDLPSGLGTGPAIETINAIARLLASAAAVLHRLDNTERNAARAEGLAAALHGLEAERQRDVQAERLAGIASFAAGAAHEINNPLAVISGRAQLLLSQATAPAQQHSLETIVQQSRRIGKIVSDLMQFARPPEPKLTQTDLASLLQHVAGPLRERLAHKKIRLVEQYPEARAFARIDRHQVEQAILHGLLNAEHAMEGDGGTLTLSLTCLEGQRAEIGITDTGGGIAPEALAKAFDPFYTTKQFREGSTGLGLTVCRGIVEAHGGTVSLHSRPGQGSTLRILLPLAEPLLHAAGESDAFSAPQDYTESIPASQARTEAPGAGLTEAARLASDPVYAELGIALAAAPQIHSIHTAAPAPPLSASQAEAIIERVFPRPEAMPKPSPAKPSPAGHGRILVIEENEDLREVLRAALSSHGHAVDTAPDGLEGLASALADPPALILAATQLSGVDAVTLIRQVRQRYPSLPIIVLGGPGADDRAPEALRAGARSLLHKPFDFERLLQEIAPLVGAKSVA